jgi:thiamine biosynthesis lipoprotein
VTDLAPVLERRVVVPFNIRRDLKPPRDLEIASLAGETMGTSWQVKLVAPPDLDIAELRRAIETVFIRIIAQMSPWELDSDLSRFNRAASGSWHDLPLEFATVLDYALSLAEDTAGAYDPTIGPLVDLWGFGPNGHGPEFPRAEAITEAKARCGWQKIASVWEKRRVCQTGGVTLDLCGIAKGFAVDCLADILRAHDCRNFLVEIGGELRGEGVKSDGTPWWVEVEAPPGVETGRCRETLVALHGLSVATSGDYRRYFTHDGRVYAHTIDPRTGHPLMNDMASVTVLHAQCMCADALATALMVLGEDESLQFAAARNIAALFMVRTGNGLRQAMTPAFAALAA